MTSTDLISRYETLVTYRKFEETIAAAVASGEVHGEMHLGIGQEAIAVALGLHLRPGDAVVSTHRPHLHALALGVDPVGMLAEILERDGLNHGKGGHMHLFDPAGFMCTGIVGAGAPLALGYALKQALDGAGGATVAIVGDGAMNQGAVFESMNLAAVRRLPVVFLCEDNAYSISVRKDESTAGELAGRGEAFGIPGSTCDGTDVAALEGVLGDAFRRARQQRRPTLVVTPAYRFRGHYEGDLDLYRAAAEKEEAARSRDPVAILRGVAERSGVEPAVLDEAAARAAGTVEGWFRAARQRPAPRAADARAGVYADA
jgi:acetoin:2,6-dichlorophenolindophenol oxidoreductase subunit alpha